MGSAATQQKCALAQVYLGLGANLGDLAGQISRALDFLREDKQICVTKVSSLFYNPPLTLQNPENTPWYLNSACQILTDYSPDQLLDSIKAIEKKMGRLTDIKWASRLIDIDILFYNNEIIHTPRLKIPHPELSRRLFVLKPLNEIAPQLVHPDSGRKVSELLEALP